VFFQHDKNALKEWRWRIEETLNFISFWGGGKVYVLENVRQNPSVCVTAQLKG